MRKQDQAIKQVRMINVPGQLGVLKMRTVSGAVLYLPMLAQGRPSRHFFNTKREALAWRGDFKLRLAKQYDAFKKQRAQRFWKIREWLWRKRLMWRAR